MKWTNDQQKAIEARKGTLLVSAAAGSGKTAVLVERVIERLCDEEQPCGVENLLIVTFTNAAAAQMKEKISAAISKKTTLDPQNKRLRRQQLMLPCASICTIDSFCIGLVRENFHTLGISPDFELLDEGKRNILKNQAIKTVIEEKYKKADPDFLKMCTLISDNRDDKKLISAVFRLYELSQAYPFPQKWINSLASDFERQCPTEETQWCKQLLGETARFVESACEDARRCLEMLEEEPQLYEKYAPAFVADGNALESFGKTVLSGRWDDICSAYASFAFEKLGRAPSGYASPVKDACQTVRKKYTAEFKAFAEIFEISSEEHLKDIAELSPAVRELIGTTLDFYSEFSRLKREENGADFSDTLHFALSLLVEDTPDGIQKTPLAQGLSENYAEILVDEYQDVNEAQDMIFSALSKDETNLFMVGDVKQSIYRFRQAMPEIFLRRRDGYSDYEGDNYPARVVLGKNFRSRSGVTGIVNYIFSAIMSRETGGLEYDEKERLEAAAVYPEVEGADTELCLVEGENGTEDQAAFVADYIEKAVSGGMKITDNSVLRGAKYKDFCLLFASVKNSSASFVAQLTRRGIPVSCESGGGFLTSPEISFMISLLKVIDNPTDDIPLTAVLLSPAFGFLPDDLAVMRADHRDGSIYHCLVFAAENGNEKARSFLERLAVFRRIACTVRAGELVRRLVEETGYYAIVCAMKGSESRRANLNRFIDLSNKFEGTGSIASLLRYIDKIIKSGGDIVASEASGDNADAVKIMTVHKSKGLEFPVCILCDCQKNYSDISLKDDLIIAPQSGIGIKNCKSNRKFDTLPRLAAKLETRRAERSEALRVLYVALTRAKERLVMVSSSSDWGKTLSALAAKCGSEQKISPYTVGGFSCWSDCIVSALLKHPDANSLRMAAGLSSGFTVACDTPLKAKIYSAHQTEEQTTTTAEYAPDFELVEEIKLRLEYEYPFAPLEGVVAKRIASNLESVRSDDEYFATQRPSFASKGKLTPAQRGTATHRFMQYANYERASTSVKEELKHLVLSGMLTDEEAEAVDVKSVSAFFESEFYSRMRKSEKIYKEYSFTCSVPVAELYPEIPDGLAENEVVMIEGVADCAFVENGELVIVDYKTDRAHSPEELIEKYSAQLGIYARCLSEVLGRPVRQTVIYSFRLGREIEL